MTIAGQTYREFEEIISDKFENIIRQGHMSTSSQPAIGQVTELYDQFPGEKVLNVTMATSLQRIG